MVQAQDGNAGQPGLLIRRTMVTGTGTDAWQKGNSGHEEQGGVNGRQMNGEVHIGEKMARIAAGRKPRVLDLFSGCGGISLGFQSAGCEIVGAVESDPVAASTHARNFHGGSEKHARARDITKLRPSELARQLGLGKFPDGFRFEGAMNPAFRQIGNAVPPLVARAMAVEMVKRLRRGVRAIRWLDLAVAG